jgi:hypothetical protein
MGSSGQQKAKTPRTTAVAPAESVLSGVFGECGQGTERGHILDGAFRFFLQDLILRGSEGVKAYKGITSPVGTSRKARQKVPHGIHVRPPCYSTHCNS